MKYMYNNKKNDQNVIYTLNTLIYDYLIKMKYEKASKAFALEAQIEDVKLTEGPPLLSQWYIAFHEISSVRSGVSSNPGDLSRIEGIMLKLENEKKRYQQMGGPQQQQMGYFPEYKAHPMYYGNPYHDQRKVIDMYGPPMDYPRQTTRHPPPCYENASGNIGSNIYEGPRTNTHNSMISPGSIPNVQPHHHSSTHHTHHSSTHHSSTPGTHHSSTPVHPPERLFGLREVSSFRITDATVLTSTISREHNIMFNVVDTKKVCAFNCSTMKPESELDTNGKQLTDIRVRDFADYVFIVGSFAGKELMILRYLIKEAKFDILGYLRGHSSKIISFDISDYIYSLDESFILRKWSFKGSCEREEILSGSISSIFSYSDSTIILTDSLRVYLYDFEMNMEMQELYKGEVVDTKRGDDFFIFIFRDKACIVDRNLSKTKFLSVPHSGITTGCYLENDIFLGSQQTLWYESLGRLNKVNIYESGDIVSIESISKFKAGHMVSINSNGEFKLMCKTYNE